MLYPGLYEQVINNALNRELADIPEARKSTAPGSAKPTGPPGRRASAGRAAP